MPLPAGQSKPGAFADAATETTEDLDVFVSRLNTAFYPAKVEPLTAHAPASAISALRMTHITVGLARPGTDVTVDPGALASYHVNVPLSGHIASACGPRTVIATPTRAAVFTPHEPTRLTHWEAGAAQLCIKIRPQALEREAARLIGRPLTGPIHFALGLDLNTTRGASWRTTLSLLLGELREPRGLVGASPLFREQLEMLVISGLILAQHSSLDDELTRSEQPLRPRTVNRVIELLESDPGRTFSLGELAAHAGVSARRLQQSFAEHVGDSPIKYLRDLRLQRAHRDLLETNDSIGLTSARWGFTNPGRFAAAYREMYGRAPSQERPPPLD
jgi:AraC-like DNA-binding protein